LCEVAPFGHEEDGEVGRRGIVARADVVPDARLIVPLVASRTASAAATRNMTATTPASTRSGRTWKRATPTVTAMTAWTTKAPAAPSHTDHGLPRVDITSEANIVLSGSSPTKITGKTAATMARFVCGVPHADRKGTGFAPAPTTWLGRRSRPPARPSATGALHRASMSITDCGYSASGLALARPEALGGGRVRTAAAPFER